MTRKVLGWRTGFARGISRVIAAAVLFTAPAAVLAQAIPSAAPPVGADGKPLTFDVISIREDKPERTAQGHVQNGPTPDGYHLQDAPLLAVIQTAYLPLEGGSFRPGRITNLPPWAFNSIHYDIDARVSEAELPRWRDPALQPAMLRAMLQAMLADRFKFAVHRDTQVVPIYELALGKKGPKFKPTDSATLDEIRQKHPDARRMSGGTDTIMATGPNPGQQMFFGVTMPELGRLLSNLAGRPVQDKTGLTGKYDVSYQLEQRPPQQEGAAADVPPDFFNLQISSIVQDQLGLQLRSAKAPVESLVIDHVEQPSEN
jgi:uncharacterized protein (TIGR03435 family)